GLSVLMSVLTKWSSSGVVANVEASIPWLVLFVLLVVLGGKLKEAGIAVRPMASTGAESAPGAELEVEDTTGSDVRRLQGSTVLGLLAFVVALGLPLVLHGPKLGDLTAGAIFTTVAVTLVVLTGWAGQISIAQFSFVGVGAFCVGHFAGTHGQNFLGAALLAMAISVPLGLLVGLPSLRLKGLYLALATLAFALIMDNIVFNSVGVSGGLTGMTDPRPRILGVSFASNAAMYELGLVVLGAVLLAAFALRRGPVGRRLLILRDSPLASSTLGVNLTVTKLVVFAACGMVAALGGALLGAYQGSITPFDFSWSWSLQLLLLVVLGGRSRLSGALIAGAVYTVATVHLLPIPGWVEPYIQLGVAVGVVGLGRNPEGTVAISVAEAKRTTSVLRPRPRRPLPFDSILATALPGQSRSAVSAGSPVGSLPAHTMTRSETNLGAGPRSAPARRNGELHYGVRSGR
ncbi:MAG TPA: branched-chain amino acid ABC transporter permease, partial [Acidimicrobiales bacterium]|nr:branched-chain amino acid ABC transporter permease [Acidimicrobiales bacterium]